MGIPTIGLQESLKSNGIIIATNYNLKADTFDIEECMLGLKLNINAKSQIKIVDDLCFIKRPNAERLNGLQQKFHIDGLLVLNKLKIQPKWYDIPSGQFVYIDNTKPGPFFEIIGVESIPWTNVYVKITSEWEYHDFISGKWYLFSLKNDKLIELKEYVKDIDEYMYENYSLFDSLLYENGSLTAAHLLKPVYEE